jgi:hypothetical protein
MKKYSDLVSAIVCFTLVNSSSAWTKEVMLVVDQNDQKPTRNPAYYHSTTYVSPPPEIADKSKNKYYDFTISGFQDYLDDLGKDDQQTKEALQPDLDHLRSKVNVAKWVMLGGVGAGVILGTTLFFTAPSNPYSFFDSGYSAASSARQNQQLGGIIGGIGLIIVAVTTGIILSPGNGEIRKFVNKNNELSPKHQLELRNLGFNYDPQTDAKSLSLSFNF